MSCYHPSVVSVGKASVRPGAKVYLPVTVPCGHCLGCRSDQARNWAVRLVHHGAIESPAWFVTLTYAPDKVPEHGSLDPSHPHDFLRRLRRLPEAGKLTYYLAGEYGEHTFRPHYHAVLFRCPFRDRELLIRRNDAPVYVSESLTETWGHGLCEFTALNFAAARYVAAYVRKKVSPRADAEHYTRVDPDTGELVELVPEFSRMSRRTALGRTWLERYWRDVYPRDYVAIEGQELKPPRYYDKWMDKNYPRLMMEVREKRWAELQEVSADRLRARERIHEAKVSIFQGRSAV